MILKLDVVIAANLGHVIDLIHLGRFVWNTPATPVTV